MRWVPDEALAACADDSVTHNIRDYESLGVRCASQPDACANAG
jgi:hypothetical protein